MDCRVRLGKIEASTETAIEREFDEDCDWFGGVEVEDEKRPWWVYFKLLICKISLLLNLRIYINFFFLAFSGIREVVFGSTVCDIFFAFLAPQT